MKNHFINAVSYAKKTYRNYIYVILCLILNKQLVRIILRGNNKQFLWTNLQVRNYLNASNLEYGKDSNAKLDPENDLIEFTFDKHRLMFYGILENGWVYNEFLNFEYKDLDFKGKTVLDIGANTGGTSIYFALNGASKVYAIEPMPKTFSLLRKNIEVNNLLDKIVPILIGIGRKGNVILDSNVSGLGAQIPTSYESQNSTSGENIEIKSLKDLINELNIEEYVLKMDCEGCEYSLLNEENDVLRRFRSIELEFHYGYKNIKEKLMNAGFSTRIISNEKSRLSDPSLKTIALNNNDYTTGILFAKLI